jgi:hypothetical protein
MTVAELISALSGYEDDVEVTDVFGLSIREIQEVQTSPTTTQLQINFNL